MGSEILVLVSLVGQLVGATLAMTTCCFRFARGLNGQAKGTVRGVGWVMAVGLVLIVLLGGTAFVRELWSFSWPDWYRVLRDAPEVFLLFPVAVMVMAIRCAGGVRQGDRAWMRPERDD